MKLPGMSSHHDRRTDIHEEQPLVAPSPQQTVGTAEGHVAECNENKCTIQVAEENLVAHERRVPEGEVRVHTEVDELLQHIAVDTEHDEVFVEHVPINQVVSGRTAPWQENDTIVVPVYEEQVVVTKRLVLKEQLRIRRIPVNERTQVEERVRRERPVIEETGRPGIVREGFQTERHPSSDEMATPPEPHVEEQRSGGIFHRIADLWDHAA